MKTGETAFNRVFGMGRWEYLAAHPDAAATFNRMSASNTEGRATPIVEAYDFSAATTVIDLGGGRGGLMAAILTKHPAVKGVLTDLPAVAAEAKAFIATQGLGERCKILIKDLLESVPQGGDIYVMKSVLHGLNDNQVVAVLKNCRAAMTASATLLVIEAVLPPHGSPSPLITMLDVHRMVINGGRERSQDELRAFLARRASACIVSSGRGLKTTSSRHCRSSQGAREACPTTACRRRQTASARASLPLFAAPDAGR